MNYSGYRCLDVQRAGRVLRLVINRPDVLNAVNGALHEELARIFYDIALDAEAEIVVFTGAGKAFCAGGDIDWMQRAVKAPASFEKTILEAKRIIFSILDLEKPLICAMNGDAIGLGATMALFCDIIIAPETAKIGDPHVGIGLVAGDGGAVIWPQLVGYARAKEFLMLGNIITADKAAEIGLINHAVPSEDFQATVDKIVGKLDRGALKAIRWSKVAVNIGLKQLAHSIMDAALAFELASVRTADHAEAVAAFAEKRRPAFTGK